MPHVVLLLVKAATVIILVGVASAHALPIRSRCVGSISSVGDISSALQCTSVTINALKIPAGKTIDFKFLPGTVITQEGDVELEPWDAEPAVSFKGQNIKFNGNGHTWNANGQKLWNGKGSGGGVTFKLSATGLFDNMILRNPVARAFSVSNPGPLTISRVIVDVRAGAKGGGHNTDGFDVSDSVGLTIENCIVANQDDCLAINDAAKLTFRHNTCIEGHGISIGSIKSGAHVKDINILYNKVIAATNALRIKTYLGASDASVAGVNYVGNVATGITKYGIIINQDYTKGSQLKLAAFAATPAMGGVSISDINFAGQLNQIEMAGGQSVLVKCGPGSCSGKWDWRALQIKGGGAAQISHAPVTSFSHSSLRGGSEGSVGDFGLGNPTMLASPTGSDNSHNTAKIPDKPSNTASSKVNFSPTDSNIPNTVHHPKSTGSNSGSSKDKLTDFSNSKSPSFSSLGSNNGGSSNGNVGHFESDFDSNSKSKLKSKSKSKSSTGTSGQLRDFSGSTSGSPTFNSKNPDGTSPKHSSGLKSGSSSGLKSGSSSGSKSSSSGSKSSSSGSKTLWSGSKSSPSYWNSGSPSYWNLKTSTGGQSTKLANSNSGSSSSASSSHSNSYFVPNSNSNSLTTHSELKSKKDGDDRPGSNSNSWNFGLTSALKHGENTSGLGSSQHSSKKHEQNDGDHEDDGGDDGEDDDDKQHGPV